MTMLSNVRIAVITLLCSVNAWALECASVPNTEKFFPPSWGIDVANTRYVTPENSQITADNVHQLQLKWAYGLSTQAPRFYPLVTSDTIFIGDIFESR